MSNPTEIDVTNEHYVAARILTATEMVAIGDELIDRIPEDEDVVIASIFDDDDIAAMRRTISILAFLPSTGAADDAINAELTDAMLIVAKHLNPIVAWHLAASEGGNQA